MIAHLDPQQYQADMRTAASGASVAQAASLRLESEQKRADVNLAWRDIRHRLGRFLGISLGLSLLFTVVLAMAGIYQGLVEDATSLARAMRADLWVVQRDTYGPFADSSRIDPSAEWRAAAVPGVTGARAYTYQILQRK